MAMHKVEKRLYYTVDKQRVVEEGDPAAAFLYATPGMEVPEAEAERLGLTGKKVAAPEPVVVPSTAADPAPAPKAEADAKADAKPAEADEEPDPRSKAVHAAEDKAVPGPRARER